MNQVQKYFPFRRETLDEENFLQSFLHNCIANNLLSDIDFERIQIESIRLLAKTTEKFTQNESSSVKIEVAENLLKSLYYTASIYLKSLNGLNEMLQELLNSTLEEIYQKGSCLIRQEFEKAKLLFEKVQKTKIVNPNKEYNYTIDEGIGLFFSSYNIQFFVHETPCDIDYPLCHGRSDLVGIEFISNYLKILYWENFFCEKFSPTEIHLLLKSYNESYEDILINIFERVLINSAGRILCEKDLSSLDLNSSDIDYIKNRYLQGNCLSINEAISAAVREVKITSSFFDDYIRLCSINISGTFENAVKNNRLDAFFFELKQPKIAPKFTISENPQLDNESLIKLLDAIQRCRSVEAKVDLIKSRVHNLHDLIDLLESTALLGDEFFFLYENLSDLELALLLKNFSFFSEDIDLTSLEPNVEWQERLIKFLTNKDKADNVLGALKSFS